jgi:hypothetical protein
MALYSIAVSSQRTQKFRRAALRSVVHGDQEAIRRQSGKAFSWIAGWTITSIPLGGTACATPTTRVSGATPSRTRRASLNIEAADQVLNRPVLPGVCCRVAKRRSLLAIEFCAIGNRIGTKLRCSDSRSPHSKGTPSYDVAALELDPMRYCLLSILAFVAFLASSSISSIAEAGCKEHEYESLCAEDPSCTWGAGSAKHARASCREKKTYTGCGSHSEFYCEANGCQWDSEARKCIDKNAGLAPPSATAQPGH